MTDTPSKRPGDERRPERKRRRLVEANSGALEAAISSAIANGAKPESTVVLLLEFEDELGGVLAKLLNPDHYEAALRTATPSTARCLVIAKDRKALARLFANISQELGEAVAAPPPPGSFSVLCIADGFEVFSGPLPLTGSRGEA